MPEKPCYVTDTHGLIWYLYDSAKLGPNADRAFRQVESGEAILIVPIIVIAELIFLVEKRRTQVTQVDVDETIKYIDGSDNFQISPFEMERMRCLQTETAIPTMHDRMIVCDALFHGAKLITRDKAITQAGVVQVIW